MCYPNLFCAQHKGTITRGPIVTAILPCGPPQECTSCCYNAPSKLRHVFYCWCHTYLPLGIAFGDIIGLPNFVPHSQVYPGTIHTIPNQQWKHVSRPNQPHYFSPFLPNLKSLPQLLDTFLQAAHDDQNSALVKVLRTDVLNEHTNASSSFVVDTTKATVALLEDLIRHNFSIKLACEELLNTSNLYDIDAVIQEIENGSGRYTTQHFYVTGPLSQALPAHADPYDVVVLQLGGMRMSVNRSCTVNMYIAFVTFNHLHCFT